MRDLLHMIDQVRRYMNDTAQKSYADDVVEEYLRTAAETYLWPDLAEHPTGRRLLLKRSAAATAEAEPALPEDCMGLEAVQVAAAGADVWYDVPRRVEGVSPRCPGFVQGSAVLFNGSATAVEARAWDDDTELPGHVHLYGNLAGLRVRFRYVFRPMFPLAVAGEGDAITYGSFAAPDPSDESIIQSLPPSVATAVERMAASLMGLEELEDGKPVGPNRQMYVTILQNLCAVGSPADARTHSIRIVR